METVGSAILNDIVIKQEPVDDATATNDKENNNSSSIGGGGGVTNDSSGNRTPGAADAITKDGSTGSSAGEQATPRSHSSGSGGPLRYISRRGRPPGGGYSMKSAHSPYVSFGQSSTGIGGSSSSHDFLRQSSLGASSGSPQDLLKAGGGGLDSGLDALDSRRFGLSCFEGDKNAFRCDGCDVVFGSRDTYAMHMLLRAKNESCVALPTASISANPENPTPREKFERELREKAMINAIRSQAALMSKAAVAAAVMPRSNSLVESAIASLPRSPNSTKDDLSHLGTSDFTSSLSSLFAFDSYGLYMDQRQYRRLLSEYGFRAASSSSALSAMMEQLSCSVCGEVFPNKDSLAMHMMFHTRDEENESKPIIPTWKMDPASTLEKMLPLSVNTDSSSSSRGRSHSESGRKQEALKSSGDKQLTAERIAELKRMAIESSLKSSLRKHPSSHDRRPRPKSASEDTVVTSSAQTRPLSADDAVKMSRSAEKRLYKPHKTALRADQRDDEDNNDAERNDKDTNDRSSSDNTNSTSNNIPFRKRTLSISDDYLNRFSPLYKRQKYFYDNSDFRNMGLRYDQFKSSSTLIGETAFPKLCDNHVSSASGPQDSDETSNGSSTVAMETNGTDDARLAAETSYNNNKLPRRDNMAVAASSSLDNIMSSDTILVPVEHLDDEVVPVNGLVDAHNLSRGVLDPRDVVGNDSDRSAAIDFSVGKQRGGGGGGHSDNDDVEGCSNASSPVHSGLRLSRHVRETDGSSSMAMSPQDLTDGGASRRSTSHPHRGELLPDGTPGTADAKENLHSDGRRSNDVSNDSSRVGEARYCVHCEILFLDVTLFHLHMGLHNVNNPWQCNICGLACGGRLEFNTHVLHY